MNARLKESGYSEFTDPWGQVAGAMAEKERMSVDRMILLRQRRSDRFFEVGMGFAGISELGFAVGVITHNPELVQGSITAICGTSIATSIALLMNDFKGTLEISRRFWIG